MIDQLIAQPRFILDMRSTELKVALEASPVDKIDRLLTVIAEESWCASEYKVHARLIKAMPIKLFAVQDKAQSTEAFERFKQAVFFDTEELSPKAENDFKNAVLKNNALLQHYMKIVLEEFEAAARMKIKIGMLVSASRADIPEAVSTIIGDFVERGLSKESVTELFNGICRENGNIALMEKVLGLCQQIGIPPKAVLRECHDNALHCCINDRASWRWYVNLSKKYDWDSLHHIFNSATTKQFPMFKRAALYKRFFSTLDDARRMRALMVWTEKMRQKQKGGLRKNYHGTALELGNIWRFFQVQYERYLGVRTYRTIQLKQTGSAYKHSAVHQLQKRTGSQ